MGAPRRSSSSPPQDVLSGLAGARRPDQILVGFAAEHGEGAVEYGRASSSASGSTPSWSTTSRSPGIGFDADENEVTIVTADGERHVPRARKDRVADAVLDEVERLESSSGGRRWSHEQAPVAPQESEAHAALARRLAENVARRSRFAARRSTT